MRRRPRDERKAAKTMSRGEFLGVGAGAAAALGTVGVSGCAQPLPSPPAPDSIPDVQECVVQDCNWRARELKWCIPAGILNSLWSDFFPRLVAISWIDNNNPSPVYLTNATDPAPLQPGMTSEGLYHLLEWLRDQIGSNSSFGSAPSSLRGRLEAVMDFFDDYKTRAGQRFPIGVAGRGGYDFLLSDWGIELFMPEKPENGTDLLRYYAFRRTGRPSLGIPSYLTGAVSLVSIDAPTGPSQIEPDPWWLAYVTDPSCPPPPRLLERLGWESDMWELAKQQVDPWRPRGLRAPDTVERRDPQPLTYPDVLQIEKLPQQPPEERAYIRLDDYVCTMRASRCWQVEGAVYRGFATELPRIVATAWMDPNSPEMTKFGQVGYHGLRELFRQRLETMLPGEYQMAFQEFKDSSPVPDFENGAAPDQCWNREDLMITNRGFFFPQLDAVPAFEDMLAEIALGKAGNPVFTDSKRPDGEE